MKLMQLTNMEGEPVFLLAHKIVGVEAVDVSNDSPRRGARVILDGAEPLMVKEDGIDVASLLAVEPSKNIVCVRDLTSRLVRNDDRDGFNRANNVTYDPWEMQSNLCEICGRPGYGGHPCEKLPDAAGISKLLVNVGIDKDHADIDAWKPADKRAVVAWATGYGRWLTNPDVVFVPNAPRHLISEEEWKHIRTRKPKPAR